MRRICLILIVVLLICSTFGHVWAKSEGEKAAVSAAQVWLSLIDSGNYAGSWKEASGYFRGAVTEQSWVASLEGVRKPLGDVISRKVVRTQQAKTLPGAPDGRYVVMSFKTGFEQKKSAVETVTFMVDNDKRWRAAGYYIK